MDGDLLIRTTHLDKESDKADADGDDPDVVQCVSTHPSADISLCHVHPVDAQPRPATSSVFTCIGHLPAERGPSGGITMGWLLRLVTGPHWW